MHMPKLLTSLQWFYSNDLSSVHVCYILQGMQYVIKGGVAQHELMCKARNHGWCVSSSSYYACRQHVAGFILPEAAHFLPCNIFFFTCSFFALCCRASMYYVRRFGTVRLYTGDLQQDLMKGNELLSVQTLVSVTRFRSVSFAWLKKQREQELVNDHFTYQAIHSQVVVALRRYGIDTAVVRT